MYCRQWQPNTIAPAVGEVCRCKAKAGLRRSPRGLLSNTIVITAEMESGFIAKYDLVTFRGSPVFSCTAPLQMEASIGGCQGPHLMGPAIPNVLPPGAFVWFEKTQGLLMKVLNVPGWLPIKQLAVRVHFLRCSGLLDDWSVEDIRSRVFV
ncbi:e3 ubiquitin-protein ligase RNF13 [Trichonephila clavipes]|uniref:E3 ubiquitin-protein ligase RNF13 n=1 Tax=Trichonephila clavipes TaxID=2585209 RepID=A0A8X6S0R7_TRICX|nr:e3 ubiquitin-protein ligase RNF13 [Trichonephila clavipes]